MTQTLTKTLFSRHVNTRFELLHPVRPVDLVLEQIDPLSSDPHSDESFSLLFVAAGGEVFTQATYRVRHEELGTLDLFLVPVRHDAKGVHYEALFNRMSIRVPQK